MCSRVFLRVETMKHKEDLYFLLKLVGDAIESRANKKLKHDDMTLTQGRILSFLYERSGEKVAQKDLEDYFQVSHATIAGILKRLELKGYIGCETDPMDKRMKIVYLRPEYKSKSLKAAKLQKEMEAILTKGMEELKVDEVRSLLQQMLLNLET